MMQSEREILEQAAKEAGVTLKLGGNDGGDYAVIMWRSGGPMIHGANSNRVLICKSHFEAMLAVEIAGEDLKKAKDQPGYFDA